ncbi:hypothetical protein AGLY_001171 [Aphis glycines]|uniref:Uncharacterized protein n=1 Tax=Aphis glycines TaxID=307491 RepID=A0A6G0U925_APHGL|nr:hypothetical protein AGLY_001171 [Aphis glycines]
MIRILINLLFDIRFNGVQNLDIFIDYFNFQKTCVSTTLKCEFCKILSYCTLNLWYDCTNVPYKLQALIYQCSHPTFISELVNPSYDYARSILLCRQSTCDGLQTPRDVYFQSYIIFFFLIRWIKYNYVPSRGFYIVGKTIKLVMVLTKYNNRSTTILLNFKFIINKNIAYFLAGQ